MFSRASVERSKKIVAPFLCIRSWELGAGEDGEKGRMEPEGSGKLGWIAASAMASGPRNRSVRRPEQSPQISATKAMFRTGAGGNDWCIEVESPS